MIRRGQIFVRDCGRSRANSWVKSIGSENRQDYALLGIVEVPAGAYDEHIVRGFYARITNDGLDLAMNDYQRALDDDGYASDIGTLATNDIWPRPDPLLGGGGGLVLRDTRMPARNGCKIMLLLGVASLAKDALADQTMYEVTGAIGRWPRESLYPGSQAGMLSLANPIATPIPMGQSLNQIHKLPLWGWDKDKVAFTSTMDLATIDRCQRVDDLRANLNRTQAEQAELDQMIATDNQHGGIFCSSADDPLFQRYRRRIAEIRGPQQWDRLRTRAEIVQDEVQSSQVLREIMDENSLCA